MRSLIFFTVALYLTGTTWAQHSATPVDFDSQVAPILKKHCASCHNDDDSESDFNVVSVAKILEGSSVGPAIIAGKGAESHIIKLMRGSEEPIMPPEDEFERVPEAEIAVVENWINAGAKPSSGKAKLAIDSPKWKSRTKTNPAVLSADWSSDGKLIAIARYGKIQLLDSNSLEIHKELGPLPGKVNSVQFSADGTKFIAASGISGVGGEATIWDTNSFEVQTKLSGHGDVMYDAVISPDGKLAATSAYDKAILLWDLETGKEIRKLKGHNSAIYDLDFSPDSKNLVSASGDQTIMFGMFRLGRGWIRSDNR